MRNTALLAAALATLCLVPQAPAETIVVTGARMVDVLADIRALETVAIVMKGGVIVKGNVP